MKHLEFIVRNFCNSVLPFGTNLHIVDTIAKISEIKTPSPNVF